MWLSLALCGPEHSPYLLLSEKMEDIQNTLEKQHPSFKPHTARCGAAPATAADLSVATQVQNAACSPQPCQLLRSKRRTCLTIFQNMMSKAIEIYSTVKNV